MEFKVSVIMPVYNALAFVEKAVESVVHLDAVEEVILIEDKSPDNSLSICRLLDEKYNKVKLFQHPNGENRGAGESRNLGILNANCDYISFLDADDFYLPNRFNSAKEIFTNDDTVDFTFGIAQNNNDFDKKNGNYKAVKKLDSKVDLFYTLLKGNKGFFHTNCVTVKRSSLLGLSLFDTTLRLHQDTELWLRMAFYLNGKQEGVIVPTAVVRIHPGNRIVHRNNDSKLLLWKKVSREFNGLNIDPKYIRIINTYLKYYEDAKSKFAYLNKLKYYLMVIKVRFL